MTTTKHNTSFENIKSRITTAFDNLEDITLYLSGVPILLDYVTSKVILVNGKFIPWEEVETMFQSGEMKFYPPIDVVLKEANDKYLNDPEFLKMRIAEQQAFLVDYDKRNEAGLIVRPDWPLVRQSAVDKLDYFFERYKKLL